MRIGYHRFRTFVLVCGIVLAATAAHAQTGRIAGVVKDEKGEPIKGATITAENERASPKSITTTTDDKGRFSMIGLSTGMWTFTATAPGFAPSQGSQQIATLRPNNPLEFKLAKGATGGAGALAGVNAKELQVDLDKAEVLFQEKKWDEALAAYQAILTKAPSLTVINLQVGNIYRQKKDYDKALGAYQEILKTDANNERAKINIGMTYLEKGDFKAADETLSPIAAAPGANRDVVYNLGEVKFVEGQADEAAKLYQKASELDPAWGKPIFKLGLVALNKGDKEGAIKQLEKVIAVDPNSAEAAQAKAVIEQLKK